MSTSKLKENLKSFFTWKNIREQFFTWNALWGYILSFLGAIIYAAAIAYFIKPKNIPIGGASGIGLVVNYIFNNIRSGDVVLFINLPLYIVGLFMFNANFLLNTIIASLTNSYFLNFFLDKLPQFEGDPMLSALYGGLCMGIGIGIVFRGGSSLGGTEIITKIIHRFTGATIGTINMIISSAIILISSFAYSNNGISPELIMYAIIIQFVSARAIDTVLHGAKQSEGIFIITEHPKEISDKIMTTLRHGVTSIDAKGMFTGTNKSVLLCTIHRSEAKLAKKLIHETDPASFIMITDVKEVYGKGFQALGA